MHLTPRTCLLIALLVALLFAATLAAAEPASPETLAAATEHFTFHSDFEINLNDALLEAGRRREKTQPELFGEGDEVACFEGLAPSEQAGWNLAVDYYAQILSPHGAFHRTQYWPRASLAGVEAPDKERDQEMVAMVRGFIAAATPAYRRCKWPAQDAANRAWVASLLPLLEAHADSIAGRLAALYGTPLGGLPIRVDVVETVSWSGANTILLNPAGGHILISTANETGPFSLELVFHEASHTLMGGGYPIQKALSAAAKELDQKLPRDLWHGVLFYTTGDAVRRTLADAGEPDYTPMMFSGPIFERFHEALLAEWTPYLSGELSLDEAVTNLVRAHR